MTGRATDAFTIEYLRSVLSFDQETGEFNRISKSGPNVKVGAPAGHAHASGYRYITVKGKKYAAHRLAWFYAHGRWPSAQLDHVNGDTSDNRLVNLREAEFAENTVNRRIYKNNKSGYKGVSFHKASGQWRARIYHKKQCTELGGFASAEEAARAYDAAAKKQHGKFAQLNWSDE